MIDRLEKMKMRKIFNKRNLNRLYNIIRFAKMKTIGKNVSTEGRLYISSKAEVSVQGELKLGRNVTVERGTLLAVRQNALLTIGSNTFINRNVMIVARESIKLGENVLIAPNVCIFDHDHVLSSNSFVTSPIVIGDGVWIGANCNILKGVKIGRNCVIGAGSTITHDVPDNTVLLQKKEDFYSKIK